MEIDANKQYQVAIKGLCFDTDGKLMVLEEAKGVFDLPGGRIEHGEELVECLRRECREEIGLACTVLEDQPSIVYATIDNFGNARLMVFYRVQFDNFDFTPSNECVALHFVDKQEMAQLNLVPQIKKLVDLPWPIPHA